MSPVHAPNQKQPNGSFVYQFLIAGVIRGSANAALKYWHDWTSNANLMSTGPMETNISQIWIQQNSIKMSSVK